MDEEKERKTISLTKRQIGTTGLIGLAVAIAPYLKEAFVSKSDGEKVTVELQYLRRDLNDLKASVDKLPENLDKVVKESMLQVRRDIDRNEKRVENLEVYALKAKKTNTY